MMMMMQVLKDFVRTVSYVTVKQTRSLIFRSSAENTHHHYRSIEVLRFFHRSMSSSSYNPLHSIKLSSIVDSIPDWDKPEGAQTNTEGGSSDMGKNLKAIVDKSSAFFNPPSWLTTTPTNDSKPLSQFPPEDDSSSTKKAINKAPAWIDSTEASKQVSKQTYKSDTDTEKNDNNNKPIIDVDLSDIPEEVQEKMRKYHLVLRGSYMAISTLMFIAAVQSMIFQFDVGLIFMALYTMVFSCMLCCFELALTVSKQHRIHIVSFYQHDNNSLMSILLYCTHYSAYLEDTSNQLRVHVLSSGSF